MSPIEITFNAPFDIESTFTCGQIFRYSLEKDNRCVYVPIKDRILKINQKAPCELTIDSNVEENLESIASNFLRTEDDYRTMLEEVKIDDIMEKIVDASKGLRLLKQDLFECTFSFMLSQCSNIPRITQNLYSLVKDYGERQKFEGKDFFLFPTPQNLMGITEEEFREMGYGYRAKYLDPLVNACPNFLLKEGFCEDFERETEKLNKQLKSVYGIGQKVADCVQLFGVGDLSLFPVDTWMKKFMKKYYCTGKKVTERKIRQKGRDLFGEWAGYAQQFIFHYARNYEVFETKKNTKGQKTKKKKSNKKVNNI